MKRLLALILSLFLLLGSVSVLAESKTLSVPASNVSDTEAPNIIKYTFAENGKTVKPGDVLHFKLKLDDQSDIAECQVLASHKTSECYIAINLEYNAASDMYTADYPVDKIDLDGTYLIRQIYVSDKYGSYTMKEAEGKELGSFTIKNANKNINPKATVTIKENGKTLKPEEEAHLEVKLAKAIPNVASVQATFVRDGKKNDSYLFDLEQKSAKVYEGIVFFPEHNRNDKYILKDIYFFDENFSVLAIIDNISGQYLRLKGASNDSNGPVISSATLKEKGKTLTAGQKINFSVKAKDESKRPFDPSVIAFLVNSNGRVYSKDDEITTSKTNRSEFISMEYNKSSGKYEASWKLPKDLPDGTYFIRIIASDMIGNSTTKDYTNLSFTYTSPDYADKSIKAFVTECFKATAGRKPTKDEINEYGVPLASGKKKAVNIIKAVMKKAKLYSGDTAAQALWTIMQGKAPTDAEKAKTVEALKDGLENAIDSLNNAAFRKRCKEWGINAGNFGTKKSDTKVASVDVSGGHYTLDGSKATFTGPTDKNAKSLTIQDTVTANGKTYKVTRIDGSACKGMAKLASMTIGKNVTSIGSEAFKDCKKLKTVTINATKLRTVGKDAFKNIQKKATFKCPKKQKDAYKKLIKSNAPKNAKFE